MTLISTILSNKLRMYTYTSTYILLFKLSYILAFRQRATGPSRVCEGSDVTLQCVVVIISADNITSVQPAVWTIAPDGIPATSLPNHRLVFNSITGTLSDLVITNITLEDDNTVYACTATGTTITSSLVLNVTGNNIHAHVNIHTYIHLYTYVHMYVF